MPLSELELFEADRRKTTSYRYSQAFPGHSVPSGIAKLAADYWRGRELESELEEAIRLGKPIRDWSHYIPDFAKPRAPKS